MGSVKRQRTYKELANALDDLGLIMREARRRKRISMQEAADQLGMSPSGYGAIERTGRCTTTSLVIILRWL